MHRSLAVSSGIRWDQGGTWDGGSEWGPAPVLPAITPSCPRCGQVVFCGGPQCPSASLPLAPDGVPMTQEVFSSVQVWNYQQGEVTINQSAAPAEFDESEFDESAFDPAQLRFPGFITQVA